MTCSACHQDVRLPADKILLRICLDDRHGRSTYIFTCNLCGERCIKPCDQVIIEQLLGAVGIQVVEWQLPLELLEIPTDAAVISLDDVLDLQLAFNNEDKFWKGMGQEDEL